MKSTLEGRLTAPPSKSMLERAIALACLAEGETRIALRSDSLPDDVEVALRIAATLGARVERRPGIIAVSGPAEPAPASLDCGESALCLRMFAAVAASFASPLVLVAGGSLRRRCAAMIEAPLRDLGATCRVTNGFAPVMVMGPLRGGIAAIDGSLSSQLLSGLLIALPRANGDSLLSVCDLVSKPYVRLTMDLVRRFGGRVEADDGLERFRVPGGQRLRAADLRAEGDWSGAAFLLVAGALAGRVTVEGLDLASAQPDRAILEVLERAGAKVSVADGAVTVEAGPLRAFAFDATDCPDLFPPLAVLATGASGKSSIRGAHRLAAKESDRAAALVDGLGRLGAAIGESDDTMWIEGGRLRGAVVYSHGDHRIAMALAVAALRAEGDVRIDDPCCVGKSYPSFFSDLRHLQKGAP